MARATKKDPEPTGIELIDDLANAPPTIEDYIAAASAYVTGHHALDAGKKKAAQIRLSAALAAALVSSLKRRLPQMGRVAAAETPVSGALRIANADVAETDPLDGLRLAIELKPINLAVGRAIWNRFGDIRTFAVNIHLKFPFCVIGGVLVIPTVEEKRNPKTGAVDYRSTTHLINRAVQRFVRAGGRKSEADAPHLLEAIAVVAYDPETGLISETLPVAGSGLRWNEFIDNLVTAYDSRFVNEQRQAELEEAHTAEPLEIEETAND